MSRSVLLISPWLGALASCVVTGGAIASDLTIRGRASETVELNDNFGLRTGPPSGVLGSYSSGNFTALYRTPATRFTLNGDIAYRKYFGPGAQNTSLSETISDGLNMRFERDGKVLGDKDFAYASYRRSDASIAQRDLLGFSTTNVRGDLIVFSGGVGSARRLSDTDTISGSLNVTQTTYSPASTTTTPFSNYTGTGGWSHKATSTIDLNASSSLGWLIYDNTANTKTVFSRTTGGASIRLTDRLSVSGNAGVAIYKTKQDGTGPVVIVADTNDPFTTPLFTPAPAVSGTIIGPVFDARLSYRLLKATTTSFSASQSISPGALGALAKSTQFALSANHTINSVSNLAFSLNYAIIEPPAGGTASDVFTGSASYSYRLAREWNATATYIYRRLSSSSSTGTTSSTSSGTASSNALIFIISKDFVLKP